MGDKQKDFIEDMSWGERRKIVEGLAVFGSLAIMVFVRQKIGFRMLKPIWLVMMAAAVLTLVAIYPSAAQPLPAATVLFALAMAALGIYQRWRRWGEICSGARWHTRSPGVSYLETLPLPVFFRSCRRVNRFIEPALCAILAGIAGLISHMLGALIFVSAISLLIYENALFERMLERDLNTLDGLVEAEIQGETAKFFEGPQPEQKQRSIEDTAGIPTGIAPDIEKQVELRKARRRAAPDNMAKEGAEVPA